MNEPVGSSPIQGEFCCRYTPSPIGRLLLVGTSDALHYIGFPEGKGALVPEADWHVVEEGVSAILDKAAHQLDEYFAGHRHSFDLTLAPVGTAFQIAVWNQLSGIPFGETRSYAEIAAAIGKPAAVRAVGAANGRNPLPIVVPCHRVVGSNRQLTGFGGGLPAKVSLLTLEGVEIDDLGRVSHVDKDHAASDRDRNVSK
ncbi:MAG: methylated-DNA--[protein]-cysteine S-methyltransferase [Pseudomonadota bacterium]